MALINYATREINVKIVYYGPGLGGKTTNLKWIYSKMDETRKGKLITLATDLDRTLFFDFLPIDIATVQGFTVRFHLYTVPGQVYYNASRRLILKGADGIVFVADSQIERMQENIESLENLKENLATYGLKLEDVDHVMQYNKRDLPNIAPISELEEKLNHYHVPYFEAIATKGVGVFETLKGIAKLVVKRVAV